MAPSISLHRLSGLVAVLSLTVLPLAACGPVKIHGHELLRNRLDAGDDLKGIFGGGAGGKTEAPESDTTLFSGGKAWLHYTYIGATACALVGTLAPLGPAVALAGVAGLLALGVFTWDILRDDKEGMIHVEFGTWLAYAGLAGLVLSAFLRRRAE